MQKNDRPSSSSSRFDDPLPEEVHGESIRESSNIEHGEAGSAEDSYLSNQNDNLVKACTTGGWHFQCLAATTLLEVQNVM